MIWAQILIVLIVENPWINPSQSMVFNVKLVALDNLRSAAIPLPSSLMKIKGTRMCYIRTILMHA